MFIHDKQRGDSMQCAANTALEIVDIPGEENFDPRINNRENGVFRGKSILNIVK